MTDLLFSRLLLHVAAVMICSPLLVISQSARLDSIKTNAAEYKSFGFNASSISGLGLSFRTHLAGPSLVQFTGGLLVSGNSTSYSVGLEYQYEISRRSDLRYYIAFGAGIYNSSTSSTATAGLGFGLELPLFGQQVFENVGVGGDLFYPGIYLYDKEDDRVTFGASLYIFYNF